MRDAIIENNNNNNNNAPPSPSPPPPPPQALLERLKDYGQESVFALWDELFPEERDLLVNDLEAVDLPRMDRIIRCSLRSQGSWLRLPVAAIEPVPEGSVSTVEERTPEERERWWKMGLKAISDAKVAVLLLSGGQGTRLGSSDPKGCFNIGLPSGKSLFQLQAERILCVQRLAAQAANEGSGGSVSIHWYIMTSPFTDEATRRFFESHKYFCLEAEQVTFFQQGTIPCVSKDGRFIMETRSKLAKAPDGNGGVYTALKYSKLLEDMASRGIKYVDCYGVDNALVRVADPTFLGYFIDKGVAAAAKVVRKVTNLPSLFQLVCLHMFTVDFLNQVANGLENDSIYHLAEKKIPSIHGHTMGLKLEQFIFDAFPYAPSTALFEVLREEEFAPVKNANGSNFDTPDSAKLLVLRLHSRWVVAAGGFLTHSVPLYATGVEVSPLCSYAGENLEAICRGRTFHAPCEITF
ncbi:UDP-N-acetylglucosamine diphosphorylase 1 [Turnera subulata]|uniref:UDP-N-acetylglucosamine diphosphorylase n=1 Tax=Turnera subulata TaxID=218843 RepID=A0A9Q0JIE9_9ROSI|nr:UDP-N-acetylglucosamine diphosphorylase 1 [Turnera subulata]